MIKKRKIRRKNTRKTYVIVLPKKLNDEIDGLGLSKVKSEQAKNFVNFLIKKTNSENTDFVYIPTNFLKKHISSSYMSFLQPLMEVGIIERGGYSSTTKNICYKYRINREFFEGGVSLVNLTNQHQSVESDFCMFSEQFKQDFNTLVIDLPKLKEASLNNLTNLDYKSNESIDDRILFYNNGYKKYPLTKKRALQIAKEDGLDVIQDGITLFFCKKEEFLQNAVELKQFHHNSVLKKLEHKILHANRNKTNNRLDTNITNMPSFMLEIIKQDNNLVEIDMANAQMTFLANKIEDNSKDTNLSLFKTLCSEGELYNHIMKESGSDCLKSSKLMTFEVLFSSEKNNSENVKQFYKIFPSLKKYVNKMKSDIGYKEFAVDLQKEESKLFIDGFLKSLIERGVFCLTKHDSLIVKEEDSNFVMAICCEIMLKNNLKCTLRR